MRRRLLATLTVSALLTGPVALAADPTGAGPQGIRTAIVPLHAVAGSGVSGTARLTYNRRTRRTVVTLTVRHLAPRSLHPAHIHRGHCGGTGPILWAFRPLRGDATGHAVSTITVQGHFWGQRWYIHVHRGPAHFDVIACGEVR